MLANPRLTLMSFHEVQFPTDISRGATGGPERRTEIVVLGSGHEQRNSRWADSRRRYDAGIGVRHLDHVATLLSFFEERRGQLYGFRWKDHTDFKSSLPGQAISPLDQDIGTGDGAELSFQLQKRYGAVFAPYHRTVSKPVSGTVRIAVDGAELDEGTQFTVDTINGLVTIDAGSTPAVGQIVTAGFEFDVPVRFDSDRLEINVASFEHGSVPDVPVIEVRV